MAEQDMTKPAESGEAAVEQPDQPLLPEQEITELEKLLAAEPDDFQARCRLGELYFSRGRLDDALAAVKGKNGNGDLRVQRGLDGVDSLDISGRLSDVATRSIEDRMWDHMAAARHLRSDPRHRRINRIATSE